MGRSKMDWIDRKIQVTVCAACGKAPAMTGSRLCKKCRDAEAMEKRRAYKKKLSHSATLGECLYQNGGGELACLDCKRKRCIHDGEGRR